MSVDSQRLVAAHRLVEDALRRDQALAQENEAVLALVKAGRELRSVLIDVVNDSSFWEWATAQSVDQDRPPAGNEDAVLEALTGGDLAGILTILGYQPPPPVQDFVDDTVDAVASALALDLTADGRAWRVWEARWSVNRLSIKLGDLLEESGVIPPHVHRSRLRSVLRTGASVALTVAPAVALFGLSAGAAAVLTIPAGLVGAAASPFMKGLTERLHRLLPDEQAVTAESADLLDSMLPRRRIHGLSGVVGGRLVSIGRQGSVAVTTIDDLVTAIALLRNTANRHLALSEELDTRLRSLADSAMKLADAADTAELADEILDAWAAVDNDLKSVETRAEAAKRQAEAEEAAKRQAEAEEAAKRQAEAEEAAKRQAEAEEAARRAAAAQRRQLGH
jgi:hypothetical protein